MRAETLNTHRVVMVSGGVASFEAARRVVQRYGKGETHFWFADTRMEDEDLYRFLDDAEKELGLPVARMAEGRNPWEVFRDERFIGNSRVDPCSKNLKRKFLLRELKARFDLATLVVYLGLDWSEEHRVSTAHTYWGQQGIQVDFPLCWEPFLFPEDYIDIVKQSGIKPPRLYELGFPHNNCGGACVKAGQKQWAHLWKTFPARYLWHEKQEQELRRTLGKNVSILENRRGGRRRPMTLKFLRWRLEQEARERGIDTALVIEAMPDTDWACSCFATASASSM